MPTKVGSQGDDGNRQTTGESIESASGTLKGPGAMLPRQANLGRNPSIGFIATKPLQIMTAMNVWHQLGLPPALLSVTPNFADAKSITDRLARMEIGFKAVYSARSRASAILSLASVGVNRLFLDSDIGLKTPMAMWVARSIRPNLRFSLYEEGTGIVRLALAERPNRLQRAMGATSEFGESRLMEEVWTYIPGPVRERLRFRPVKQIECSLLNFAQAHRELLTNVFWPSFGDDVRGWRGGRCCLYLSSWNVYPPAYAYLKQADAYSICKLHPHIRDEMSVPKSVDQAIKASVPAELLIMELTKVFDSVEVLHHGTATEWYVKDPKVNFVRIDSIDL